MENDTDPTVHAKLLEGFALQQKGRLDDAAVAYRAVLAAAPKHFDALHLLGVIAAERGNAAEAVTLIRRAVAVNAGNAAAHYNLAYALEEQKDYAGAVESYDHALALQPDHFVALNNRGVALSALKQYEAAVESFDDAIAIEPIYADAYYNRGLAMSALGDATGALASYDRALELRPDHAESHLGRGIVLDQLFRYDAALASFTEAIRLMPGYADSYNSRGLALESLGRSTEAIADFNKAITIDRRHVEAHHNKGAALSALHRYDEALASFDAAYRLRPDYPFLIGTRLYAKMRVCDWAGIDAEIAATSAAIARGEKAAPPFVAVALTNDPLIHLKAAEVWTQAQHPPDSRLGPIAARPHTGKIRLGYFSMDFRVHPVAQLTAGLFEAHDRNAFEVFGFSYGPDTGDALRKRLEKGFDRLIDIRGKSDAEVAAIAREMGIDIAIDLTGHTAGARTGIFALRAAPVQVNYIGYPATLGAAYMDYIIADNVVVPATHGAFYSENIARLPWFQVNDRSREMSARVFTRAELGVPPQGFVFCCFNNSYKILPATFDGWMRILRRTEGSVLLLSADTHASAANLAKAAAARGIDPARLVFAPRVAPADYLARLRVADLFLDTLPYNAGTTASDALWAGLPVLTLAGEGYTARMAASLLTTVGLPELVTTTQAAYEDLAVALVQDPARLGRIKRAVARARDQSPLFDVGRFARNIENVFTQMVARRALVHNDRGTAFTNLGRLNEALISYAQAIALEPDKAAYHYNEGNVFKDLKRTDAALASYDRALALDPNFAAAHNNRGNVLRDVRRHDEATHSYDRAIALDGGFISPRINRGAVALDLGRYGDALADFDAVIAREPDNADAHNSRAIALRDLGRHDEAIAAHQKAIALAPDHAEAHWGLAICHLQRGAFDKGWPPYEWRWKIPSLKLDPRGFTAPRWLGQENLSGKTILLHGEQGLGDMLQFCRYAPLVARLGARVILEVPAPLAPLMKELEGVSEVVARGAVLPAFDIHCPLMSLPLAFKTRLDTIPAAAGYLKAPADRREAWRARLGAKTAPRVGLSWSGNPGHKNDIQRSIAFAAFAAALPAGFDYISLQKDLRPEDAAGLAARTDVRQFRDDLVDFADAAALVEELDLVVTVDTSTAHLAGALNKPVWILLARGSDWRWLLDRDDTPWYAAARLYRQETAGQWQGVLARVKADLIRALASR